MSIFTSELQALMTAIDQSRGRIAFTPEGVILDANQRFLDLVGYSHAEIAEMTGLKDAKAVENLIGRWKRRLANERKSA